MSEDVFSYKIPDWRFRCGILLVLFGLRREFYIIIKRPQFGKIKCAFSKYQGNYIITNLSPLK